MSLGMYLCFTLLLVFTTSSLATLQYEVRTCVVGKSTPYNSGYYGAKSKRVARYGIFGDCSCFEKRVGCPRLWYPQHNRACANLDRWINVPQKHTELEEVINWRRTTVEEVQRTPLEAWNVQRTPVETLNVQRNQMGSNAFVTTNVHKKAVYGAKKKQKNIYTKKSKSYAKPVKRYRTKEVITYRKVLIDHLQCCPPLKFWFFDFPDFVDVSDANNNGASSPTEQFTK